MKRFLVIGSCVLAFMYCFYQMGLVEMYGDTWEYCAVPIAKMVLCMGWILLVEFANGLF